MKSALVLVPLAFLFGCVTGPVEDHGDEALGQTEQRWEAESPTNDAESTHLYIAERAVSLLGQHGELDAARAMNKLLGDARCLPRWQQGLYDADWYAEYSDNGAWFPGDPLPHSTTGWKSHFYDPDTGKNFAGETKPTARTRAATYWSDARAKIDSGDLNGGCYSLGLALHYVTDVTQPMHAANFTAKSNPLLLHSHWEGWAMGLHGRAIAADWSGAPSTLKTDSVFVANARASKSQWSGIQTAIDNAYKANCHVYTAFYAWADTGYESCWNADPTVTTKSIASMVTAQDLTAKWLYAAYFELKTGSAWR